MAGSLILIANPGSASRKYALFAGEHERAGIHFEWLRQKVICTLYRGGEHHEVRVHLPDLESAADQVIDILVSHDVLKPDERIERIGVRIVAPGNYFLDDHHINDDFVERLEDARSRAPIHITATLEELRMLRTQFPGTPIAGISDSAFHITKPDYAWNYGISLEDADRFGIKRFGYHGISVSSVVKQLDDVKKLPPKLIVCHLGSGTSVTAVHGGKSVDNTMGYSPLEGTVMSTRSGSIDPTAVRALKQACRMDDDAVENYLNRHSGLLGLGGSSDIRELLRREEGSDHLAALALATYVLSIQKGIGQMAAALGGADALVFTGTVGERSAAMRQRILKRLHYLDFVADEDVNESCTVPDKVTSIGYLAHSKPVFVIPAKETEHMARRVSSALP